MISYITRLSHRQKQIGLWLFFILGAFLILTFNDLFGDNEFFAIVAILYFALLFIAISTWFFKRIKGLLNQKSEKSKMELMHLQSQVNPHFFFNTLNNLYGLVQKDSKKAQELILKLSDMMRYSIYEGQKELVTLDQEIEYLRNYIDLHKMRYHKEIQVSFKVDVLDQHFQVMPLLFIILLENSFKHGVEKLTDGSFVNVYMSGSKKGIFFSVENNFDPSLKTIEQGIGLQNLRRRLELVYPKKHTLTIAKTKDIHKAILTLNLL